MCLGIPGLVVDVKPESDRAVIEVFGVQREISTFLVGEVQTGEYLIVHTGYAIEKLDEEEALIRLKLWEEILRDAYPGQVS